ncbi:type II toxin-antitoxin system RelE/ParE family toxin [Candidatus Entotheonella palauensis]|uniref:type II toxin-antitoxin system RelE/ParE family toxin n=1 Tax=Candidatus Entotheonella palauensis TaxID=93172 RepID=UPI000B7F1287|nr:type II toxin-antitoxin system RelE/ParE family toxin [Candidatus Entotheonella palauensis]
MIEHIKHRGLRRLYERGDKSRLRPDIADKAERFLTFLDQAMTVEELDLPGFGLHSLTGNLQGFWSVSVSRNYRIIFRFEDGNAFDVDLVDYH